MDGEGIWPTRAEARDYRLAQTSERFM